MNNPNLQLRLLPLNVAKKLTFTCLSVGVSVYFAHVIAIAVGMACMVAVLALARLSLWPSVGLKYYFTTQKIVLPLLALTTGAFISAIGPVFSILPLASVPQWRLWLLIGFPLVIGEYGALLFAILEREYMSDEFECVPNSCGDKDEGTGGE